MRALLLYPGSPWYRGTGYDQAWRAALEQHGCALDVLHGPPPAWAREPVPAERWDVVIPHVLVEEAASFGPTLRAAAVLEAAGARLLNPVGAILAASDKLTTHTLWAANGLPQPRTWDLAELRRWPVADGRSLVLKPALCDGARHVRLVGDLEEARAAVEGWREDERSGGERRGRALLQEWIEEPACVRIYATSDETSAAYEKSRRPGALTTHGTVYPRVYEPPPALARLATRMVAALGGGLMGVDVLTDAAGRHWALEANAPFGFDVTDPGQGRFVARVALEAASRRHGSESVVALPGAAGAAS